MPFYEGIYYEIYGTGKPLVLTNGIMMSTKSWEWHIENLSKYFTVIVFDFLDQGKSKNLNQSLSIGDQVNVMYNLLNFLNFEKYNIVGLSYGGQVTLKLAINFPELIEKLIFSNVVPKVNNFLKAIGNIWEYTTEISDGELFYTLSLPFIYGKSFYIEHLDFLESRKNFFKKSLTKEWFSSLKRLINSNQYFDVSNEISKICNPTLLIAASEDVITPFQDMLKMKEKIKNSELICVEGAGHGLFYEKKELWTSLIIGFLI